MSFTLANIKAIFSQESRSTSVLRNAIASALFKGTSVLCSFIIVPLTINYLNAENYGIWMAMTSILYWFAFCDVGLGNGMRNYLAASLSRKDYKSARAYFCTAMFMLTFIAIAIGCIAIPIVQFIDLNKLFNTRTIDDSIIREVLIVAIVLTLLQFVIKNIGLVYVAMQKYAINELIFLLGNVTSVIAIYILTQTTECNLMYAVLAFTGFPVLMFLGATIPLLKQHPQLTPSFSAIDWGISRQIISKGLGFFVIQISSCLVLFGSANILISHFLGPQQVTVYNVAYKLFSILIVTYNIIVSPLWNAYTDAYVKGDYKWIRKGLRTSLFIWTLSIFFGGILLLASEHIYKLWVGDSVIVPFKVSFCVLLYISMYNLNNCVTYLINGLNKIRIQIITSLFTTTLFLCIMYYMKGNLGIVGISITMTCAYFIMTIIHLYQCWLLINKRAKGIWNL